MKTLTPRAIQRGPARFCAALAASLLTFLAASPAGSAPQPRPLQSLAVMDFELKGPTPEDLAEVVDYLAENLRNSNAFRRVRTARPGGGSPRDQLSLAARLGVRAAVLGQFTWNGQQYRLQLRLYRVAGQELLWQDEAVFSTMNRMRQACDGLTAGLIAAAAAAARQAAPEPVPLEAAWGFGIGHQGVSASPAVPGGSYLYLEGLALLNRFVGINARYALRLFPTAGGSHLLGTHLRFQVPPGKEVFLAAELGYLLSLEPQEQPAHLVGARLTPIAGGEDEFFFELLPVALYFDVATGKPVLTLELLSFRILFGGR
jgi:hypothetical protein